MKHVTLGALTATLLCVAAGVQAQAIYKGIDEEGRVTFSDRPPPKTTPVPRRNAGVEASEAARRLKQARLDRARGVEPGPGELTQGDGVRTVNYRYWRRQEKLRQVVEQAQRRSSETLRPQVAAL